MVEPCRILGTATSTYIAKFNDFIQLLSAIYHMRKTKGITWRLAKRSIETVQFLVPLYVKIFHNFRSKYNRVWKRRHGEVSQRSRVCCCLNGFKQSEADFLSRSINGPEGFMETALDIV